MTTFTTPTPMPEQFEADMRKLAFEHAATDYDMFVRKATQLMVGTLWNLGFQRGVTVFRMAPRVSMETEFINSTAKNTGDTKSSE